MRQEIRDLGDGARTHQLVKVPLAELDEWDRTHDPLGRHVDDAAVVHDSDTGVNAGEKRGEATVIAESKV